MEEQLVYMVSSYSKFEFSLHITENQAFVLDSEGSLKEIFLITRSKGRLARLALDEVMEASRLSTASSFVGANTSLGRRPPMVG